MAVSHARTTDNQVIQKVGHLPFCKQLRVGTYIIFALTCMAYTRVTLYNVPVEC
jgi:hypothetical protein